jgi:hypothetical protein
LCRVEYYDVCELWILEELSTVAAEFRARVLGFWDSEFESGSRHRCLFSSSSMLRCPVLVEALRWTEPPSKESYQVSKHKVQKLQGKVAYFSKNKGKKEKDKRYVKGNGCGLSRNFLEEPKLR